VLTNVLQLEHVHLLDLADWALREAARASDEAELAELEAEAVA
jgi:hypothetical protein